MPTDTAQIPPQALDAEMAVLGSMLIESDAVETSLDYLEEGMFYKDAHRRIFAAIRNLFERSQAVDVVTVGEELRNLKWTAEVGGTSVLKELTDKVATAAHVEHYARIVREKAVLRELIRASTQIVGDCYASEKEPNQLMDEAQANILGIFQKQTLHGFTDAAKLAHEAIEAIEKLHQRKEVVTGIATGFERFDRMTSGFQKGDLILIAARPSQGKTALALNIASNVVLHPNHPRAVGVFSLEMSEQALMQRLIASRAGVNLQEVRGGYFPQRKWVDLTDAASKLSEAPLFIDDSAALSILDVRSRARRLAAELRNKGKSLDLIIIDYLQLMRGSSRRVESRQQEVAEISRGLKQLARDLDIPVVALSQLSRRTEEKGRADARPQLSDLRESGALEQDADLVTFIYREGYYKQNDPTLENKAELHIAKQRNGPTGKVDLVFLRHLTRFENESAAAETDDEDTQVSFS